MGSEYAAGHERDATTATREGAGTLSAELAGERAAAGGEAAFGERATEGGWGGEASHRAGAYRIVGEGLRGR